MRNLNRLVTVQGPAQLLTALAVLDKEDETRGNFACDDYLVIHGLYTSHDHDIMMATEELGRIREWKAIVSLKELEIGIAAGSDASERIRNRIGVREADVIYAARNWQPTNEALLRVYSRAEKVLYGDGFGIVDSYQWPGFVAFDRAELCLPVEAEFGLLDRIPTQVVPRKHLHQVIERYLASSRLVSDYAHEVAEWTRGNGMLLLAMNGTESGWIEDIDTEVALYVEHVLRYVRRGQKIVIKPHPRESFGQSEMTRRILEEEHGISARVAGGLLGALPVEILCQKVRFADVLTLISVSAVHLKYLYGVDCRTADKTLTLPKLRPQQRGEVETGMEELNLWVAKLDTWDGATILYRRGPHSSSQRNLLARAVELLNSEQHAEALPLFEQLRDDGCILPQVEYGRAAALLGQGRVVRGMLALWTLRRSPYRVPASRLLESNPHTRRFRKALRSVRHVLHRVGLTRLRRAPTEASPTIDVGARPATAAPPG